MRFTDYDIRNGRLGTKRGVYTKSSNRAMGHGNKKFSISLPDKKRNT